MSGFSNYRAVIFDMDGLLLDTERLFIRAYEISCKDLCIDTSRSLIMSVYGVNSATTVDLFSKYFRDTVFGQTLFNQIKKRYEDLLEEGPVSLKPGVPQILKEIQRERIQMCVATSTSLSPARLRLTKAGILSYFQFVIGGDQVENGKPAPDIYLRVAHQLGVQPESCLVFEDSDNGVRAARGAGMTVIQVPDLAPPCEEVVNFKHLVVPSLLSAIEILRE